MLCYVMLNCLIFVRQMQSSVVPRCRKNDLQNCHCQLNYDQGTTENARPENDGVENDGQIPNGLQGLENARLENDGQNYSNLRPKLRDLENAELENDGQTFSNL